MRRMRKLSLKLSKNKSVMLFYFPSVTFLSESVTFSCYIFMLHIIYRELPANYRILRAIVPPYI